jgi:hypothetical protein
MSEEIHYKFSVFGLQFSVIEAKINLILMILQF